MINFYLIITRFILFRLDKAWAKYKDLPLSDFSTSTTVASEATVTLKQKKASELNEYLSDVYTVKKRARLTDELEDYLLSLASHLTNPMTICCIGSSTRHAIHVSLAWHVTMWQSRLQALLVNESSALGETSLESAGSV